MQLDPCRLNGFKEEKKRLERLGSWANSAVGWLRLLHPDTRTGALDLLVLLLVIGVAANRFRQ